MTATFACRCDQVSHHGSRANVTNDLLKVVKAKRYVCSTNNSYFKHPDEEAVARVIVDSEAPTLWFNYDTPQDRRWDSAALKKYGYHVNHPDRDDQGITLTL